MDHKKERKDMTLPEFGENFLKYMKNVKKVNGSENTIKAYRSDLVQFFDWLKEYKEVDTITYELLNNIIPEDLHEWMGSIKVSASTKARKVSTLHSFFNYLNDLGHIQNIAHHKLRKPKLPKDNTIKYLPSDKAKKFMDIVKTEGTEQEIAIINTFLNTGMRISEIIKLNLDDIDGKVITVRDAKGQKSREIVVEDEDIQILNNWLKIRPKTSDKAVFLTDYFNTEPYRITRYSILTIIEKFKKKAKIKKLTPHMLRHTYGTARKEAGVSLDTLADSMGHSSIRTTMIYAKVTRKEKERVAGLGRIG